MRALRAENLKLTSDVTRLAEKHTESQRKADIATAAETTLRTQLKSAEANARTLKEEAARMKSLVAQSRASCATEIRRRDRQIDTLKKQLGEAGRSRGTRANPAVTTITVSGEVGMDRDVTMTSSSIGTPGSDLQNGINCSFANLTQHLTEENDAMLVVMGRTMDQLRDMTGWSGPDKDDNEVCKRPDCEDMAAEIDNIMSHMRNILTNPSFVPIEEVMQREEEINRLKRGWVTMENRWREAVHLIEGWRKRMAASGRPVCDEELQMGLRLSPVRLSDMDKTRGLAAVLEEEMDENDQGLPESPYKPSKEPLNIDRGYYGDMNDEDSGDGTTDYEENHEPEEHYAARDHPDQRMDTAYSSDLQEKPRLSPLRNSNSAGNRGSLRTERLRPPPSEYPGSTEEEPTEQTAQAKSFRSQPVRPRALAALSRLPSRIQKPKERPRSPSRTSLDDVLLSGRDSEGMKHDEGASAERAQQLDEQEPAPKEAQTAVEHQEQAVSFRTRQPKLPPQATTAQAQQSPLTMSNIAAKLAASEKEADAARVRAKLKAARCSTRSASRPVMQPTSETDSGKPAMRPPAEGESKAASNVDPVKQEVDPSDDQAKPEKRKRDRKVSKAASRRRSTLSPLELETLISGNAS